MRWVIGDIHGMLRPLETVLSAIEKRDPTPQYIFVGDYVNRGPDSARVIDLLLSLRSARFIRGNHDDAFDLILNGTNFADHPNIRHPLDAFAAFIPYGMDATLLSYGTDWSLIEQARLRPTPDLLHRLTEAVPISHRGFIRSLIPLVEESDLFVAHAFWPVNRPTEDPDIASHLREDYDLRHSLVWGRYTIEQVVRNKAWEREGVFGHTPVQSYLRGIRPEPDTPLFGPKIALLDTAPAIVQTGRLTAYSPDSKSYLQANRLGEVVESDRPATN